MGLITLCTDFGSVDHYVPTIKARAFEIDPTIQIIDISHEVKPHDLPHAAFLINSSYPRFPSKTVHLVSVHSVLPNRRWIAFERNEHFFVCPDNGLMGLINGKQTQLVELIQNPADDSFPASNLPLEIAAKLAKNHQLNAPVDVEYANVKQMLPLVPKLTRKLMRGHIIHVDVYGNLISNLPLEDYKILSKDKRIHLRIGKFTESRIFDNYDLVDGGDCIAFFNSIGLLQITITLGDASQLLGLGYGAPIQIEFLE